MNYSIAELLQFEQQLRRASSIFELGYTIVNELNGCLAYDQAVLALGQSGQPLHLAAVSDLPEVDHTAPFVSWIERLAGQLNTTDSPTLQSLTAADVTAELAERWPELAAANLLVVPLLVDAQEGRLIGLLLLFRQTAFDQSEQKVLQHIGRSIGHALFAMRPKKTLRQWLNRLIHRRIFTITTLVLIVILLIPVRMSTLAPARIIPKQPYVVTASIDGVLHHVEVAPNQQVKQGALLAEFDTTELNNQYQVAQQSLLVAETKLQTAQQSGFMDPRQKSQVAQLQSQVRLQHAELLYAKARLARAQIFSPREGLVILDDPQRWKGQPVRVGQRIMLIASPHSVEVQVLLPVKDSIALQNGAKLKVFLDNDPLHSWEATLQHASFEPQVDHTGQSAYRLIAQLNADAISPRIGLRGVARIYGERVTLFFYLFHRPITALRQWIGW